MLRKVFLICLTFASVLAFGKDPEWHDLIDRDLSHWDNWLGTPHASMDFKGLPRDPETGAYLEPPRPLSRARRLGLLAKDHVEGWNRIDIYDLGNTSVHVVNAAINTALFNSHKPEAVSTTSPSPAASDRSSPKERRFTTTAFACGP